jgi:hypothetical protein
LEVLESRLVPYAVSGNAWPHPELITISFMPDGTNLGGISSNLFATFNAKFGSAAVWQNQILKAAQVWAQQTDINFAVVPDNGADEGSGLYQQGDPGFGDIRIGGYDFGVSTLAQAYMPPPVNNYSIAGDINFNTGQTFNIGRTFDLFTVAVHEFGHALGLYHSGVYCADMYGYYTATKYALTSDDIAGVRNIYSADNPRSFDAYTGSNNTFTTAADLTASIDPNSLTYLGTNLNITNAGQAEYFTVAAPSGASGQLTVNVQSQGLSLLAPTVYVYDASYTLLGSASGAGQYGATLSVTINGVSAGAAYYVKVTGAYSSAFGTGAYALTLNFGNGLSPAVPLPNTQTLNGAVLSSGGGQAIKQAQEFLVNTTTADVQQTFPQSPQAVAMDANGNFVITWSSHNQDGAGWGVYAQRYDVNGVPQGGEFRVNTYTQDDQMYSTAAMDPAGDFVITWSSHNQDGNGWEIYAQRYNAAGVRQGGEFRVNTTTQNDQEYSTVAMDGYGNFVVTWSSNGQDGNGWGIYAQRYNAAGVPQGGEFRVNTHTQGDQEYSTVAMDPAGDFVVTWSSHDQDGSGWGVYAQRYNSAGAPQGGEFQVNTYTQDDQMYSTAAMDAHGNFVITWSSHNQDGSGWGVYGQRYNAAGVRQGGEFRINTYTQDDQEYSTVAMDANGNFFVTWSSHNQGSSYWGVYGRQFNAAGAALGNEFQVNTTISGDQQYSSVAMDGKGHAVVVWSGNGPGDNAGVFAQRYSMNNNGMSDMAASPSAPELDGDYVADPSLGGNNSSRTAASLTLAALAASGAATNTGTGTPYLMVRSANGTLVHPTGCRCPQCSAALAGLVQQNTQVVQPPSLLDAQAWNNQLAEESQTASWPSSTDLGVPSSVDLWPSWTRPDGSVTGPTESEPSGRLACDDAWALFAAPVEQSALSKADQPDLTSWAPLLPNGLADSAECFQQSANNVRDWLFSAYQDTLGRQPDEAGAAAWLPTLEEQT